MKISQPKSSVRYFLVMIQACLLMFAVALGATALGFFVAPVTEELGFSRSAFTLYVSIYNVTSIIAMPFVGRMITKVGIRKVIFIGGIVVAAGFGGFAMSSSLISFYVAAAVFGLAIFGTTNLAAVIIVNTWFIKNKGAILGIVMACSGVSGAILGVVMPGFIANNGWRAGYWALAVAFLVCTIPGSVFLLKDKPSDVGLKPYGSAENAGDSSASAAHTTEASGISYASAMKMPQLYMIYISIVLLGTTLSVLQHLPAHFTGIGMTGAQAGSLLSVLMIGMIITKILLGVLNDKLGSIIVVIIVTALTTVSLFAFNVPTYTVLAFSMAAFAFGSGSQTIIPPLITGQVFGQKDYSKIWSTIVTAVSLGNVIGTPSWGAVYDLTGSYSLGIYISICFVVLSGILYIICLKSETKKVNAL